MTFEHALDLVLGNLGVLVLLLLILIGGFKGYWVYGFHFDAQTRRIEELERRLDRAGQIAERGTGLARRAVDVAATQTAESADRD